MREHRIIGVPELEGYVFEQVIWHGERINPENIARWASEFECSEFATKFMLNRFMELRYKVVVERLNKFRAKYGMKGLDAFM
jgi:hypothetical protein